ncbi:MAG: RNA polymerase sigma factor [Candidatus Promineifilaceae bacterium]
MDSSIQGWLQQTNTSSPDIIGSHDYAALIDRCLKGDTLAHAALYREFASMIYRLNMSLLGNVEDAEEVLQDSFEYAFRRLETFDPSKSAFKTWLYRIAISRCRNKRRRKWLPTFSIHQVLENDQDIPDRESLTPSEAVHLTEEQQRVAKAVSKLSNKLREVAVLRYYEGLRYPEIGAILGISHKTAESRMRLAHKRLRVLLSQSS